MRNGCSDPGLGELCIISWELGSAYRKRENDAFITCWGTILTPSRACRSVATAATAVLCLGLLSGSPAWAEEQTVDSVEAVAETMSTAVADAAPDGADVVEPVLDSGGSLVTEVQGPEDSSSMELTADPEEAAI